MTGLTISGDRASAEATMAFEAGFNGYATPGRPFVVTFTISTDALFEGDLVVSPAFGGPTGSRRHLEIAGGTTREVTVVIESSPWEIPDLRAQLLDGTEVVATASIRMRTAGDQELVGVMPGVTRDVPETSSLSVDAGSARLFAIDASTFEGGVGAIAPLDIIATTAADLRELDGVTSEFLLTWLARGGRLLVDEAPGTSIPVLPEEWIPDNSRPVVAGIGEVVLTHGRAAAGEWDEVLDPTATRSRLEEQAFADMMGGFWGGEPLSWSLGRDAGFRLPGVVWMLVLLGAYVFVIGPVVWFVLRSMRRPGLAWIVIPTLAVLFTGTLWWFGSSVRTGIGTTHGTIIEVASRGSTATSYQLVHSRSGGEASVRLPPGWTTATSFNEPQMTTTTLMPAAAGASDLTTSLDAGAFALLGGTGPMSDFDGAIEVVATSSKPGVVTGTVTSHLDHDLHDLAVFADLAGAAIGDLPAGATVEFEVSGKPVDPNMGGEPVEWKVWRDAIPPQFTGDFGRQFEPGPVSLGLWSELLMRGSFNDRPVGTVTVAGWSNVMPSPINAQATTGNTLVVARARVEPAGVAVTNVAALRYLVRGPSDVDSDFRNLQMWGGGATFAFDANREHDDLVLTLPNAQMKASINVDGDWRVIDIPANKAAVVELPTGAIDERGRVYVNVLLTFERGTVNWRELGVRSATSTDRVTTIEYATAEE